MISMDNWATKAVEKLENERKQIQQYKADKIAEALRDPKTAAAAKASLMADAVLTVLKDFCRQAETFAESVVKGNSFVECMNAVTKDLGYYAEGTATCKKAVEFYVPGADVEAQWSVVLPNQEKGVAFVLKQPDKILDLGDFFK